MREGETHAKPFSEACARNREPILRELRRLFADRTRVLEIGSGTGQHAVHFAGGLPHLIWYASDLAEHHDGIRMWLEEAALSNLRGPLELDVAAGPWPAMGLDAVFSANTVHIISWPGVEAMFRGIGGLLPPGGKFALYGPFNYAGRYTSESNAAFDRWLRARDPRSGIRDFESVDRLANLCDLVPVADLAMPSNNRLLCWQKRHSPGRGKSHH